MGAGGEGAGRILMDPTIEYYDRNADQFVRDTVGVDVEALYEPFLERVPAGGKILDAGCGSGRDSKAFLDLGFQVVSLDASEEMVRRATQLTGLLAEQLTVAA